MKRSFLKRFFVWMLVIAAVLAVYSPSAYCETPSPTDGATVSPEDTGSPEASPTETNAGFQMLMLQSKGPDVIRLQMRLRELGYFNFRATGNYFNGTKNAVTEFQEHNGLSKDGRVGENTYKKLYSISGLTRRPKSPSVYITAGPQLSQNASYKATGELGDWASISAAFPVSTAAPVTVTDCVTGKTFNMVRTGGTNLAEVETATSTDYAVFKECFGGKPSWEKRAVVVTINGAKYAASLFGNPGGSDSVAENGMDGHTTLYFYGSTTDVSGFADKEDLKQVLLAAGKKAQY